MSFNYEHIDAPSDAEFVIEGVKWLSERIQATITGRGNCIVGLSGGSTPKAIYDELGKDTMIDWSKVYLFLVDDRYVVPDDKNSNQRLIRNSLLKNAGIPEQNLFFPDTTEPIKHCIDGYAKNLVSLFTHTPPDIVVLGMGNDGHIGSLFPPVPKEAFDETLVLHTTTDIFPVHDRITVSPLVIMASQAQLLLLRGDDKKQVLDEMVASDMNPVRWPMHVALSTERTTVLIDQTEEKKPAKKKPAKAAKKPVEKKKATKKK